MRRGVPAVRRRVGLHRLLLPHPGAPSPRNRACPRGSEGREMNNPLSSYEGIVGSAVIRQLRQLGEKLAGTRVVHVNSTREGGGVAEILEWMIPLMGELGLQASWEVIQGTPPFFEITKSIHNGLQGHPVAISIKNWKLYEDVNARNFERLGPVLSEADAVFIHDPQPAYLLSLCGRRKGKWIWRAHIDISRPYLPVWKMLRPAVEAYDASIFSMAEFARMLPHP